MATGQTESALGFSCSNGPTRVRFRLPAGTTYKAVVKDCERPANKATFAVSATGEVTPL